MTVGKAREILLEKELRNLATMMGDYSESATALEIQSHWQRQDAGECWYYYKPGHKEDFCWKEHPKLALK